MFEGFSFFYEVVVGFVGEFLLEGFVEGGRKD